MRLECKGQRRGGKSDIRENKEMDGKEKEGNRRSTQEIELS